MQQNIIIASICQRFCPTNPGKGIPLEERDITSVVKGLALKERELTLEEKELHLDEIDLSIENGH
jgi:hypothetical protein